MVEFIYEFDEDCGSYRLLDEHWETAVSMVLPEFAESSEDLMDKAGARFSVKEDDDRLVLQMTEDQFSSLI